MKSSGVALASPEKALSFPDVPTAVTLFLKLNFTENYGHNGKPLHRKSLHIKISLFS